MVGEIDPRAFNEIQTVAMPIHYRLSENFSILLMFLLEHLIGRENKSALAPTIGKEENWVVGAEQMKRLVTIYLTHKHTRSTLEV